ncbi:TrbI/VirB10 family protein [Vibrio diabolicus]|uniref:TrbI/VirB10 family protein n=1 Tax=Vibrio diabolicus TaxID=50719 RepID=UPI00193BE8EB|nr:TrbI/VirB10 family protein [Vibrio diabolicus]
MSDKNDQMSPEASPGDMSNKTGVRRVNNRPMMILGGVLGSFLLVMMLVAADRSEQQNAPQEDGPKELAGNTSMFANEITSSHSEGFIPAAQPPAIPELDMAAETEEPKEEATAVTVARPVNPDLPPTPPSNPNLNSPEIDEEANRIRMAKLQLLQEAVSARTGVQGVAPRSAGSTPAPTRSPETRQEMLAEISRVRSQIASSSSNDPNAAYQARLAQIKSMTGGGAGGSSSANSAPMLMQTSSNGGNGYGKFDSEGGDRWKLNSQMQAPRSPFELRAGFVIPATLISGINSDLPGQIMAQVSQNVSDTATGSHLLIPQGSRLIGSYSSDVAYGQERVLVAWQRIIFPDGKAMDIGSMPGADSAGYSGFHDQVNNHYLRIFGSAFLMSGITAGITLSQDNDSNSEDGTRASDALSEALGQQLGQVAVEMIRKNMNISPTLEIRPGYRFNVIVTKDMTFSKPYRSFDY